MAAMWPANACAGIVTGGDKWYLPDKIMTWYNKKPSLYKCINEIFMCAMNCFIGL